jgi:mono/diheme cytochrome c family protein
MPEGNISGEGAGGGKSRRRYLAVGILVTLAGVALAATYGRIGATVGRRVAARRLAESETSAAQWWLAWGAWFDARDYQTDLLAASVYRQDGRWDAWEQSLRQARDKGAPDQACQHERNLGRIQSGGMRAGEERILRRPAAGGAWAREITTALVLGYLARDDTRGAQTVLESAPPGLWGESHADYLWGVLRQHQEQPEEAMVRFRRVLERHPGHEPARAALANVLEDRRHLDEAFREYAELAARSGGSRPATLGLARILKKLGRLEAARALVAPLAGQEHSSSAVTFDMACIDLELGQSERAEQQLRRLPFDETTYDAMYSPLLIALGVRGKGVEARRLYDDYRARTEQQGRNRDLVARLVSNPANAAVRQELEQSSRQRIPIPPLDALTEPPRDTAGPGTPPAETRRALYAHHCSACHGEQGDGHGPASRHLYPRPRDLRTGRCQLVSTRNGVPTLQDVEQVLAQGMSGTSMQAFKDLAETDRRLLAEEVLRLRAEGVREQVLRSLREAGEDSSDVDLRQAVAASTTPASPVRLPRAWQPAAGAAGRGKQGFQALGCSRCHGDDGRGAADQLLFDDQGEPARPRDLVYEPLKGGREPPSLGLRIAAGMPGTPHPAVANLSDEQLVELVEYVRCLAREPQSALTNFARRVRAMTRDYLLLPPDTGGP